MMSSPEYLAIMAWLIVFFFLQVSTYLPLRSALPRIALPVSFSLGLVCYMFLTWFLTLAGIFPMAAVFFFLVPVVFFLYRYRGQIIPDLKDGWDYYALFFLVFSVMLLFRLSAPDITGAEKFMDHAFIASIMHSPVVPPLDPWFAGGTLEVYYYLGHWMLAMLGLTAGIPSEYVFTLALPTVASITAVSLYATGRILLNRFALLPVIALFAINPAFLVNYYAGTPGTMLLWNSTRVIPGTINEYPLFSFLFGDVHAHVLGMIPQTSLILLVTAALTCWVRLDHRGRLTLAAATIPFLASVPVMNSWDILIWAPLIVVAGIILVWMNRSDRNGCPVQEPSGTGLAKLFLFRMIARTGQQRDALLYLVFVPLISFLVAMPIILGMQTQSIEGIGLVHDPSPIIPFFLVHGWFFLVLVISLRREIIRYPWVVLLAIPGSLLGYPVASCALLPLVWLGIRRRDTADLLAGAGLFILVLVELVYLADNMGESYYRMNTVFKLYIGAWLLLGTGAAVMAGREAGDLAAPDRTRCGTILTASVLILLLVIPALVAAGNGGSHTPTLDGQAWLAGQHPDDDRGISYIRALSGSHVIVEAVGADYSYHGRISSMTGIPSVLGWQFHEYMWRGDTPPGWYGERAMDVRAIYEQPERTISLMKKYVVDLLYVGETERESYDVRLPSTGLIPVYSEGSVTVYGIEE